MRREPRQWSSVPNGDSHGRAPQSSARTDLSQWLVKTAPAKAFTNLISDPREARNPRCAARLAPRDASWSDFRGLRQQNETFADRLSPRNRFKPAYDQLDRHCEFRPALGRPTLMDETGEGEPWPCRHGRARMGAFLSIGRGAFFRSSRRGVLRLARGPLPAFDLLVSARCR